MNACMRCASCNGIACVGAPAAHALRLVEQPCHRVRRGVRTANRGVQPVTVAHRHVKGHAETVNHPLEPPSGRTAKLHVDTVNATFAQIVHKAIMLER